MAPCAPRLRIHEQSRAPPEPLGTLSPAGYQPLPQGVVGVPVCNVAAHEAAFHGLPLVPEDRAAEVSAGGRRGGPAPSVRHRHWEPPPAASRKATCGLNGAPWSWRRGGSTCLPGGRCEPGGVEAPGLGFYDVRRWSVGAAVRRGVSHLATPATGHGRQLSTQHPAGGGLWREGEGCSVEVGMGLSPGA